MKKFGFTLAEVLITLGIIGVIAAITLPSLMTDTTSAQIGPKLAKAVAMFEQANQSLIDSYNVEKLSETGLVEENGASQENYIKNLSRFIKISKIDYTVITGKSYSGFGPPSSVGCSCLSKDGVVYMVYSSLYNTNDNTIPHKDITGVVWIDINGTSKPNTLATDVFVFQLMNDGSLQPAGSTFLRNLTEENGGLGGAPIPHWTTECNINEIPSNPLYCAGHVFENNLKVLYK